MSRYTLGPDVGSDDEVYDTHGNRIDQDYIDQAVADVHRMVGRPSLSADGGTTQAITFRVPAEERANAQAAADEEGISLSEYARRALEDRLDRAS